MACQIKRNSENKLTEVLAPNGNPSALFDSLYNIINNSPESRNVLLSDPYVSMIMDSDVIQDSSNEELALAAWSKAYSADFIDSFGDWKNKNLPGTDFNGEPLLESLYTFGNQIIKPGVSELFESNPELANQVYSKILAVDRGEYFEVVSSITPQQKQEALQQYSAYLNTVFPESEMKDIMYHGSRLKEFNDYFMKDEFGGFIFTTAESKYAQIYADSWGGKVFGALLNYKNSFYVGNLLKDKNSDISIKFKQFLEEKNNSDYTLKKFKEADPDSFTALVPLTNRPFLKEFYESMGFDALVGWNEIAVFEPEQIHILSSKADIQGFKDFMSFENSEFSKYGTYQQFRDFITSKSSIEIENKLIETGKIDRAC